MAKTESPTIIKVACPTCKAENEVHPETLSGCGHKQILPCHHCRNNAVIWKDEQGVVQIQKRPLSLDDITEFKTQPIEFDPMNLKDILEMQPPQIGEVLLQEGKNYSLMYIHAYLQEPGNEEKFIAAMPPGGGNKVLIHTMKPRQLQLPSDGIVYCPYSSYSHSALSAERFDVIKIYSL